MIRRSPLRLAVVAAAAAVTLSGCATFSNTDVMAEVDGADISVDRFDTLATEYFSRADVFGTSPIVAGRADGEQARPLMTALVRQQLSDGFLDRYGVDPTEVRIAFKAEVLAPSSAGSLSNDMQDLITAVDETPRTELLGQIQPPTEGQLRAIYADDPAKTGMLCMRHILVATEADAEQVLADLAAGADFGALALERSIDPTAADNAGVLANGANDCIPLQIVLANFDPAFTEGALAAREGVPSQPVESSFGWHIILHRPWDEIANSVLALHQPGDSGGYLFDGYVVTAPVRVDPRFGSWDPLLSSVVPVG